MRDEEEFVSYVRADGSELLRLATLLVGHVDADDLVQTCLIRVLGAWQRARENPRPYSRRVLARLATDRWRRLLSRPAHDPLPAVVVSTDDRIAEVDARDAVIRALSQLPARQRATLVLRYFEQLSEAETADALGVSPGTVKTHAARGLDSLRRSLSTSEGHHA